MEQYYVVFSSITQTMRVEKQSKLPGERCSIVRTPAEFGLGSCGYSIRTNSEEYAKYILAQAEKMNARNHGIYYLNSRGNFGVVT